MKSRDWAEGGQKFYPTILPPDLAELPQKPVRERIAADSDAVGEPGDADIEPGDPWPEGHRISDTWPNYRG